MGSSLILNSAIRSPDSTSVLEAWTALTSIGSTGLEADREGLASHQGVFLRGLPLLAAGLVGSGESGSPLILETAVEHLLDVSAGDDLFLVEVARRVLALGRLARPRHPREDPLLDPRASSPCSIDPKCSDAGLSFARAAAGVELGLDGLVVEVISARLRAIQQDNPDDWQARFASWVDPLLQDLTAQCLIVCRLADGCSGLVDLLPVLGPSTTRIKGPLDAVLALEELFRNPDQWREQLPMLRRGVESWDGWRVASRWPTRLPTSGISELKSRITETLATGLGLGRLRIWEAGSVFQILGDNWPPLSSSFCFETGRSPQSSSPTRP